MAVHKLSLDEIQEIDYSIIAIHTSIEDYRLAYSINQVLNITLGKNPKDILISIKQGESFFSRYSYYDVEKDINWELIQNKNEVAQSNDKAKSNLFFNQNLDIAAQVYLIPELKKTDYFLKIEACENNFNVTKTVAYLNTIASITMVYNVSRTTIKTKNNLIF